MKIGVDFGSTYSAISRYNESSDNVDLLQLVEKASPYIPSIVVRDGMGLYYHGYGAQNKMVKSSKCKVYKAFKMLLNEKDEQLLLERGFDDMSPREVAKNFLSEQIREAIKKCGETEVEEMVICAPEVWSKTVDTLDGRSILREICSGIPGVKQVQVVSEPEAASAFFAYNLQQSSGKPYLGKILLIDYGGGTLDITLADVSGWISEKGRNSVEIKVLYQTGAGENYDKQVGNAGIAFMENVVTRAIKDAGMIEENEELPINNKFIKAVDSLESDLMTNQQNIADVFDMYHKLNKLKKWEAEAGSEGIFCTIEYNDEEIPVFFSHLLMSFQECIEPVLAREVQNIKDYMDKNKINYMDPHCDNFKIELVGGFSNLDLVVRQVERIFERTDNDKRFDNAAIHYRASAISLGAGLLAAGIISQRATARYSVAAYCQGLKNIEFAIRIGQDIEYDKIYWQERVRGERRVYFIMPGNSIDFMIIEFREGDLALKLPVKEELKNMIRPFLEKSSGYIAFGFSFDSSGVVSIHICDYDINRKCFLEDTMKRIELSSIQNMFDMATLDSVVVDK